VRVPKPWICLLVTWPVWGLTPRRLGSPRGRREFMGGMQPLQAFSLPLTLEEASFKLTENVFEFIGNYLILGLVCICCVLCVRPCPCHPPVNFPG
jgi:hypothetical protein